MEKVLITEIGTSVSNYILELKPKTEKQALK